MTKTEALYQFFNGFGITAYPTNSVPKDTVFPWLTYEPSMGNAGDPDQASVINLYYYSESEKDINAKAEAISESIGLGGKTISHDDGLIWIKRGTPWCIPIVENDMKLKRRQLNIVLQFL